MKKDLRSEFNKRQYMLSKDFEVFYYVDSEKNNSYQNVKSHAHNYYEFYFFQGGDVSIKIDGNIYPLTYGDLVIIPPHVPHRAILHSMNEPYSRFVFWISEDYCQELMNSSIDYGYILQHVLTSKEYVFHYDLVDFHMLESKLFALVDEVHSHRFGRDAKLLLCVNDLLLHINRTIHDKNYPATQSTAASLYENLLEYIHQHLDEELTLDALAKEFFVSKYHISHIFKENFGMSLHKYITKQRLEQCKNAILTDSSIVDVYLRYGFKDYSSFYRAFKKEYGMSPKEYKELYSLVL